MLEVHSPTSRAYCRVVSARPQPQRPAKRNSPAFLPRQTQIIIKGLTRLLGQLETDRATGLLLSDRCSIECIAVGGHVIDPHRNDVAAAQLAIDRKVERCEIAHAPFDLQLCPNGPDVAQSERRFRSYELSLVPGRSSRQVC